MDQETAAIKAGAEEAFRKGASWISPGGVRMSRVNMLALAQTQGIPEGFTKWDKAALDAYFRPRLLKAGFNFADRNNPVLVQRVQSDSTIYLYFCQQINCLDN